MSAEIVPGKWYRVPSGLSGQVIEYYAPSALADLMRGLSAPAPGPWARCDQALSYPLLLAGERICASKDPAYAERMFKALNGCAIGQKGLLGLANEIIPGVDLRKQIAFSGGLSPATAKIVYAPPDLVPERFDELCSMLRAGLPKVDIVGFAALLFYYIIQLHPFPDGNGRFARALVVNECSIRGECWAAASLVHLLKVAEPYVIDEWVSARSEGVGVILDSARHLVANLWNEFQNSELEGRILGTSSVLRSMCPPRAARILLYTAMSGDGICVDEVARLIGSSRKKAVGVMEKLVSGPGDIFVYSESERIGVSKSLWGQVSTSCISAVRGVYG